MKAIPSEIYNKDYYFNVCLGSEEFKRNKGQDIAPQLKKLLKNIPLKLSSNILDLGCGRGDVSIYISKRAKHVIGIDYSEEAIKIANSIRKTLPKKNQEKVTFIRVDATKMNFKENEFDCVIALDVFEHLTKSQLNLVLKRLSKILKPEGILFVHTGANKKLYDSTYKYYTYPMNSLLTTIDMLLKGKKYPKLPKNPRTQYELDQHINEPTFSYLKNVFGRNAFAGTITTEIGYIKKGSSLKTHLYNFLIALYPLSKVYPLNTLFAWSFICTMKNEKKKIMYNS